MARRNKNEYLMEDEYDDEDNQDYDEENQEGVITKEMINKMFKDLRQVMPAKITRKEIMKALEDSNYNFEKAKAELNALINSKPAESVPKPSKEVKKHPKEQAVVEEEKVKSSPATKPIPSESTPINLNQIYPNIEYDCLKSSEPRDETINLVVIGHVDSGKSTTMGHLLFDLGYVTHGKMTQYEKQSKLQGKPTFHYAWVLDEGTSEREHGVTINVALKHFQLKDKNFMLLDAPGHKDFIANMISGAAQADCAILMIDSKKSSFSAGFKEKGQTREHAILARCLGVTQLVVAINKLDMRDWEQSVYDELVGILDSYLVTIGYKKENIKYVPISGLIGENLTQRAKEEKLKAWYSGPCLAELIYEFKASKKAVNKPIRACISDAYAASSEYLKGTCVSAKIEGGAIEQGDKLLLMPLDVVCTVRGMMTGGEKAEVAKAGDAVEISIQIAAEIDISIIKSGMVLSSIEHPINIVTSFRAQIMTFELLTPIPLGHYVVVYCASLKVPAKFSKLEKLIMGDKEKKRPKCLLSNQTAFVVISTTERVCLELYQNYKGLGRIAIRDDTGTLATGIITELIA